MKFKLLSLATLAASFVFMSSAYAAGPISGISVSSKISLKEGATPLSCITVTNNTPTPSAGYYVGGVFTFTDNCSPHQTAGIVPILDINAASSTIKNYFTGSSAPIQYSSSSPWVPVSASNINISNGGLTMLLALPGPLPTVSSPPALTITYGFNFGESLTVNQIEDFLNTVASSLIKVYPIRGVTSTLTVTDGGQPAGFATAAAPALYPTISIQKCLNYNETTMTCPSSPGWITVSTLPFSAWEQSSPAAGLSYGTYQLAGNTLTIGNGAVFTPIASQPITFFPVSTIRIAYQQTANATGTVNIVMPESPSTNAPASVTGYLIDGSSSAVLATVANLQWGQTININNLAPAKTFKLTFNPIIFPNSDKTAIDQDALATQSATPFSPTTEGPTVQVENHITATPSWPATFQLTVPSQIPSSPVVHANITFTANTGDLPLTLTETVPANGAAQNVVVPGVISSPATYSISNIAATNSAGKSGYLVPATKSGTTSSTNLVALNFFPTPVVNGWPQGHVAMGNLTGDGGVGPEGLTARQAAIDAIFKYSGSNGGGDRGELWPATWTQQTIDEAAALTLSKGKPVIPVMVDYTSQMSGGFNVYDLNSQDVIAKHFTNLVMDAVTMKKAIDHEDIVGGSVVLNPDLMGTIAQGHHEADLASSFAATPVNISQAVGTAVCVANLAITQGVINPISQQTEAQAQLISRYNSCDSAPPVGSFTNDFSGWVAANNYLLRTFGGPKFSFGWLLNIWAADDNSAQNPCETGSADWIHFAKNYTDMQICYGKLNLGVLSTYHVYDGKTSPVPDYVVFDKYEVDVVPGGIGDYLFNYRDWENYFMAVQYISNNLIPGPATNVPVMLFQMPGGHIHSLNDVDPRGPPTPHISTMPDYIFGDLLLGKDFSGVADVDAGAIGPYLEHVLGNSSYNCSIYTSCAVRNYLTAVDPMTGRSQDWTQSNVGQLIKNNVFAILWGGGTGPTTSIASYPTDDGGWLYGKIMATLNPSSSSH